jgi:hypothetical protein
MSNTEPPARKHDVALWAGLSAFFASLLSIGVFDLLEPPQVVDFLGAFFVAGITAGGVYAKQRLDDAKHERGDPPDRT